MTRNKVARKLAWCNEFKTTKTKINFPHNTITGAEHTVCQSNRIAKSQT